MPLDFGPTHSMYVDRGQREVSKILSDRYMQNFMQTEAMRKEAASLEAAPFEGDEALKTQILKDTDEFISATAKKGDYENMTAEVVRAAGNYSAKTQPIKANNERWKGYQAKIDEQVQKGDISMEHGENLKKVSAMTYGGLQTDESGKVNTSSYFNGIEAALDPDIMGMMDDALKGIKSSSGSKITRVVGVVDAEKGLIEVETEKGREYITKDQVSAVIDPIFNDPKVRSYMQQTSEMKSMLTSDDDVRAIFQNQIAQTTKSIENLQAQLTKTDDEEEKADIQKAIDTRMQLLNATKTTLENDDLDGMRRAMTSSDMTMNEMQFRESMEQKYSFEKTKNRYEQHHDKMKIAQANKPVIQLPDFSFQSPVIEAPNPLGTNYKELNDIRDANVAAATEIFNFLQDKTLSPSVRAAKEAELQGYLKEVSKANRVLVEQFKSKGPSEYDVETFNRLEANVKASQASLEAATSGSGWTSVGPESGAGSTILGQLSKLQADQKALEEFISGTKFELEMPTIKQSVKMSHVMPGTRDRKESDAINKAVMEYWQGGHGATIFLPNSTERTSLAAAKQQTAEKIAGEESYILQPGDMPAAFEVVNVATAISVPGVVGPVQTISVKSLDDATRGQVVTFTAPVSDMDIDVLNQWQNSSGVKLMGHIEDVAQQVGSKNFEVPLKDGNGNPWTVQITTDSAGDNYAIFVDRNGNGTDKVKVGDNDFLDMAAKFNTSYGFDVTKPVIEE